MLRCSYCSTTQFRRLDSNFQGESHEDHAHLKLHKISEKPADGSHYYPFLATTMAQLLYTSSMVSSVFVYFSPCTSLLN